MSVIIEPLEGTLCVGQWYELTAQYSGAGTIQWKPLIWPDVIAQTDITFLNEYAESTFVKVPVEGTYAFVVECCEPV